MKGLYLAIDIGASSGRHILGHIDNGKLILEEIYRFKNAMTNKNGHKVWDIDYLFEQIKIGLKMCNVLGKIPEYISIDTWAVDYCLLDEKDELIGDVYAYRDNRTKDIDLEVEKIIDSESLYRRTGIQKQPFNTIYQLMALKLQKEESLKKAKTFLMLPDYFQFKLTGVKANEYTNASSTGLVDPDTKNWDYGLIKALGLPEEIFLHLRKPGVILSDFTEEMTKEIGYRAKVCLCASHDTASAILALPSLKSDVLYISSGTWSLFGCENISPCLTEEARKCNFTNEGGFNYRFRFLKNIMGLWMIQELKREFGDEYTFSQICQLARENIKFPSVVDVNSNEFLAPKSMSEAIKNYCKKTNQQLPESLGQLAAVVYKSLAKSYARAKLEIEKLLGKEYQELYIIGGGSNADLLNELTAKETGLATFAGPVEATAIGNILASMIATGEVLSLLEARELVRKSFEIKRYDMKEDCMKNINLINVPVMKYRTVS